MNFFKPEDFGNLYLDEVQKTAACSYANAKLEREGKVVYGNNKIELGTSMWTAQATRDTHQALLINIEPIEKCEHPKEKVDLERGTLSWTNERGIHYLCECGAKMKPKEFEEVK